MITIPRCHDQNSRRFVNSFASFFKLPAVTIDEFQFTRYDDRLILISQAHDIRCLMNQISVDVSEGSQRHQWSMLFKNRHNLFTVAVSGSQFELSSKSFEGNEEIRSYSKHILRRLSEKFIVCDQVYVFSLKKIISHIQQSPRLTAIIIRKVAIIT